MEDLKWSFPTKGCGSFAFITLWEVSGLQLCTTQVECYYRASPCKSLWQFQTTNREKCVASFFTAF